MAASTSFSISSLTPKALPVSNPKSLVRASVAFVPFSAQSLALSLNFPSSAARWFGPLSSRFARNVAISSEVDQDEDLFGSEDDNEGAAEANFSPDLKLFVGNLPFSVDSSQLAGLFESAGTVEMVEVIYDKMTGRSRGFGFVTMSSVEEVEAAARQFNGYELDGRPLRVNAGPPPPRREGLTPRSPRGGGFSTDNNFRVHVGNLSWGVDDGSLKSLFSEQGQVVEAKVIYDRESGRSRGFGFVTFNSAEEVNNAIDSLDGADLDGRPIRVTAAEARPPRRF